MDDTLDITSLRSAVAALAQSVEVCNRDAHYDDATRATLRSGVIQNFEVAYELCWKFMKRWLEVFQGVSDSDFLAKKDLFRYAFEAGLISDSAVWFAFHKVRNRTSHTYNETTADEVFETAQTFLSAARAFLEELEQRT